MGRSLHTLGDKLGCQCIKRLQNLTVPGGRGDRVLQRLRPSPLLGLLQDFSKCGLGIMVYIAPLRGSVFKGQGGLLIGKRGGGDLSLWNSWMLL